MLAESKRDRGSFKKTHTVSLTHMEVKEMNFFHNRRRSFVPKFQIQGTVSNFCCCPYRSIGSREHLPLTSIEGSFTRVSYAMHFVSRLALPVTASH